MAKAIPVLSLTNGRQTGDCTIIALSTFLGVGYDKVCKVAKRVCHKDVTTIGMFDSETMRVAKRLGFALRKKRRFNLYKDTGILCLDKKRKKRSKGDGAGHVVVLAFGFLFDGTDIWNPDEYFRRNRRYKPTSIMVADER